MIWSTFNTPEEPFVVSIVEPYSRDEIKEIVILTRLSLYNQSLSSGAHAIRRELDSLGVKPLPSVSHISRILKQCGLTYRRTGHYY